MSGFNEYKKTLPEYFDYNNFPYKVVESPGGGLRGYKLHPWTGEFERANSLLREVFFGKGDVGPTGRDKFIELAEDMRMLNLCGEGPIFDIYRTIDEWWDAKESMSEKEWDNKREFMHELQHRTFHMWEEEFARQAAGEPPSFSYGPPGQSIEDCKKMYPTDPTPDLSVNEATQWFRELGALNVMYQQAIDSIEKPADRGDSL